VEHILPLSRSLPTVLGVGGWFKNTLCLIQGNQAFITPTVGDLDTAEACANHQSHAQHFLENLPQPSLRATAHDLHPDFFSTRQALHYAADYRVPAHAVQHHHAHIAAVCAEHGEEGCVLGLALDGVGLGTDGSAWGGELLQVQGAHFERLGHLQPLQMPGGDKAAREPWRMASSVLFAAGRGEEIVQRFADQAGAAMVLSQLQRNLNCPETSSMGRVFDAAAGLLGICPVMAFEAEAAILLEKAATAWIAEHGWPVCLSGGYLISEEESGVVLNFRPLLLALADWPADKTVEEAAAVFHASLVAALVDWVSLVARKSGLNKMAVAGGCFFNRLLSSHLPVALESQGLQVLMLKQLSPGDTSIALGQAWIAALLVEKLIEEKIECV
jgi:hydrogenase maturation protein HypF